MTLAFYCTTCKIGDFPSLKLGGSRACFALALFPRSDLAGGLTYSSDELLFQR